MAGFTFEESYYSNQSNRLEWCRVEPIRPFKMVLEIQQPDPPVLFNLAIHPQNEKTMHPISMILQVPARAKNDNIEVHLAILLRSFEAIKADPSHSLLYLLSVAQPIYREIFGLQTVPQRRSPIPTIRVAYIPIPRTRPFPLNKHTFSAIAHQRMHLRPDGQFRLHQLAKRKSADFRCRLA